MLKNDVSPIKVCYVINTLKIGGAQMVLLELCTKLDKTRFDVSVYYFTRNEDSSGNLEQEFTNAGIKTVYLETKGKISLFSLAILLRKVWKKDAPDIVHAHLPYAVLASALARLGSTKIKLIVHDHQTRSYYSWKIRFLYTLLQPLIHVSVAYSEKVEFDNVGKTHLLLTPPERLDSKSYTIYNGVDTQKIQEAQTQAHRIEYREKLGCKEGDVLILSVARFIEWKGQLQLAEAFIQSAQNIPQARLCFVGTGPTQERVQKKIDQAGLVDRVVFLGDRKDVVQLLGAADIVSLIYVYRKGHTGDAVGIAGCEALATGIPLIAGSGLPIVRGLVSGKNVLLVEPDNCEELVQTVEQLCTDTQLRETLGASGKEFAQRNLDWANIVPIYERIYTLLT